jgi:hypothetical protein
MIKFRNLLAEEIECRVQQINEKGLVLLLYKNARCDMNILDETVGAENWQREHYECKGNLFCRVGICCTAQIDMSGNEGDVLSPSWVWKSDCGAESYTEKEKGEASDSFKRACVNWGIGRELYTAPFIWIPVNDKDGKPNYKVKSNRSNDKLSTNDKFIVEKIAITKDKKITGVAIRNTTQNKRVFIWSVENGN